MIAAVLFDMDGVLCDSENLLCQAAITMFDEVFAIQVVPEDFRPFIGTGEDRYLGGVAEAKGVSLRLPEHKLRCYDIYLTAIQGQLQALPGVIAFIDELANRGCRMAVASAADRIKVEGNLHEIGLPLDRFDTVITGSETSRKKPDPEGYLLAAATVGVPPGSCLVVEDAVNGCQAGKAAGCRVLGICSSFPPETLLDAGADWCTQDLTAVPPECRQALGLD